MAYAKEIQDKEGTQKKKPAGKQRTRYKLTGRKPGGGRKSFVEKHIECKRVKAEANARSD